MKKENEKIIKFLDKRKEGWATGLTYMCDKGFKNPHKVSEAHLKIILGEIKEFLRNK